MEHEMESEVIGLYSSSCHCTYIPCSQSKSTVNQTTALLAWSTGTSESHRGPGPRRGLTAGWKKQRFVFRIKFLGLHKVILEGKMETTTYFFRAKIYGLSIEPLVCGSRTNRAMLEIGA